MDFQFTVVDFPETKIVGMAIETDMSKANTDCPALWHTFGPRICPDLKDCVEISKTGESYGISKMIDENRFTYLAAVKVNAIKSIPPNFTTMTIPAGTYVKGIVPNLEKLGDTLKAMYMQWPQTQTEYQLDTQGIFFEFYTVNWLPNEPLEVYASVIQP